MLTASGDRRCAVDDMTRSNEKLADLRLYSLGGAHFELHSASDRNFSNDSRHKQSALNHRKGYENEAYVADEDEAATGNAPRQIESNADANKSSGHMTFCFEENRNEGGLRRDSQESEIVVESSKL